MKRYEVVITVTDPATGGVVLTKKHPCLNVLDACHLAGNVQELMAELIQYLPGLAVAAYEVEEVVSLTASGRAALEEGEAVAMPEPDALARLAKAARRGETHNAAWWAKAIGQAQD